MALGKVVWVLAVGKEEHADIHAFAMDKVAVAESRVHSGIITIVNKCDIVCETVELADLLQCEGGT